jgi:2-succinyl-5-enolpyruvyl-6-hydroxy-3-cyclohexene-1-carboxylate synthase
VLSEQRCQATFSGQGIIGAYDSFLRNPGLAQSLRPDWIIRFGAPPTSKALNTYLLNQRGAQQTQVNLPGTWSDPELSATQVLTVDDPGEILLELSKIEQTDPDRAWLPAWLQAESATLTAIRSVLDEEGLVSEPSAIIDLADVIPGGRTVFAGNSMPVRDIDSFWPTTSDLSSIVFFRGNRGASGIDGVVSTALGVAARSYGFLVAVIGDVSFYHDMNGLLAAQRHGLSATIVLINNDGGGIFSFLPQHEQSEDFETLFGTPHGLDFSHVGPLYGVGFQRVETRQEYRDALKASFSTPGVQVIEVRTDREANLRLHQRIWAAVAEAVEPLVEETAL